MARTSYLRVFLLCLPLSASPAVASTLTATGSGAFYVVRTQPQQLFQTPGLQSAQFNQVTLPSGLVTTSTDSGVTLVDLLVDGQAFTGSVAVFAKATAWNGILHAVSRVTALVSPLGYGAGFVEGTNPFYSAGTVNAESSFADTIVLNDPDLPEGAPVTFKFGESYDEVTKTQRTGSVFGFLSNVETTLLLSLVATGSFGNSTLYGQCGASSEGNCTSYSDSFGKTVTAVNGETITLVGELGTKATAVAGSYANLGGPNVESFTAEMDALDTFRAFVDPVTVGLQLVSASGHNYATGAPSDEPVLTPEPEPAQLGTVTAGALGLLARGRRESRLQRRRFAR